VIKRNKKREPFNSDKVFLSLVKACAKRDVEQKKIDRIVNDIELKIRNMDLNEVKSSTIGNMILEHLLKLDKIAHLRFASVYKEFNTLRDFEKEITHLRKTRAGVKKRPKK